MIEVNMTINGIPMVVNNYMESRTMWSRGPVKPNYHTPANPHTDNTVDMSVQ